MMLWRPTNDQHFHRTEMTLQAITDHLHLGIAHVRRCSAHSVDHVLKCFWTHGKAWAGLQGAFSDVRSRRAQAFWFRHPCTSDSGSRCAGRAPSQTSHQESRILLLGSLRGGVCRRERVRCSVERCPPESLLNPADKPLVDSKEPSVQDVDRQGIQARVRSPRVPATETDAGLQSPSSGAKSTPALDVPPSAAAGGSRRRYLDDPSKAQACHVSSGPLQGCRHREPVHGGPLFCLRHAMCASTSACWVALCSVTHRSYPRQAAS